MNIPTTINLSYSDSSLSGVSSISDESNTQQTGTNFFFGIGNQVSFDSMIEAVLSSIAGTCSGASLDNIAKDDDASLVGTKFVSDESSASLKGMQFADSKSI